MRYDVSDLVWSVIEPDGPFRERCPRYTPFGGVKRAPRGNSMGQMGQRVRHG